MDFKSLGWKFLNKETFGHGNFLIHCVLENFGKYFKVHTCIYVYA